jgi:hypothetical protein
MGTPDVAEGAIEDNAVVVVAPASTGPYAVKDAEPVPPPATTAVPKAGLADEPAEINGTPVVALGATEAMPPLTAPTMTSY